MSRRSLIPTSLVAAAIILGATTSAEAVDLKGGAFDMILQKPNAAGDGFVDMSTQDIDEFFNFSNCLCSVQFAVEVTLRGASGTLDSKPVEVWVGQNCDDSNTTERDKRCKKVETFADVNVLKTPTTVPIYVSDLASPVSLIPCAEEQEVARNIYLLIDDEGDFEYDNVISLADELFVDTLAPPVPEPADVVAGEAGALVTWTIPEANADDIRSFQILCARADGSWSDDDGFGQNDPAYLTPLLICPEAFESGAPAAPAALNDAGVPGEPDARPAPVDGGLPTGPDAGALPTGIDSLDPMFTCSGEIGGTTSEHRLSGLANGVDYRVFLVVIDPRLNPSWIDLGTVTPQAVTDFWEDYKDSGGAADGGYCFVATATYGNYDHPFVRVLRDFRDDVLATSHFGRRLIRAYYDNSPALANVIAGNPLLRALSWLLLLPVVLLAGAWVYTGVLGKLGLVLAFALWRVHRRRRAALERRAAPTASRRARALAAASAAVVITLAFTQLASAQPYWDEPGGPADQLSERAAAANISKWQFEIKLGPYVPDIDSEFELAEGEQGPFERMFGNDKQVMTRFELDRFFWFPSGQLGAGIGIGYLSTQANAFQVDDEGQVVVDDLGRPLRAAGDETSLRFMPFDLHAVYRFTALDESIGIPLIPYGKLGLTWYLWQITRPDGSTASVNDDPTCVADCSTNEARGGTLGWQATLGLAIRAERIDAKAAQSLQSEMGIDHAGFFGELSYAKVDGLFSDDKLRLGDFTWYAGINFEF